MPFTGYDLEGLLFFGLCLFLGLSESPRVNAVSKLPSRFVTSLPCIHKRNFRVYPRERSFSFRSNL